MEFIRQRTFSESEFLKEHDGSGFYLVKDPMLSIYQNRWEMCDKLFSSYTDLDLLKHKKNNEVNKQYKQVYQYENHYINIDTEIMLLPKSFEKFTDVHSGEFRQELQNDDDFRTGSNDEPSEMQYISRKKIFIKERTPMMFNNQDCDPELRNPDYLYFINMFNNFSPVLDHYSSLICPEEKRVQKELMLICYDVPFATNDDILIQKAFSANTWGLEHADELIGALHLGESHQELQVKNLKTSQWEFIPSLTSNDHSLWMFGEYANPNSVNYDQMWAPESGFTPTEHRMVSDNISKNKKRYSIIFNLGLS